jgi:hypothetical protein
MEAAGVRPDHDVPEGSDGEPDEDDRWRMAHGLATDIVLFEEGDLVELLRTRGHRLPPGLQELARSWPEARRTLLEVRAIEPGLAFIVEDLLEDRSIRISDALLARQVRPLDVLCARPLPDGQGAHLVMDAFLVPRGQRQHVEDIVRDGDGVDLLAWLVDPRPPMRLQTPEGDELRFESGVWVVPGDAEARRRLAAAPNVHAEGADRFVLTQARDEDDGLRTLGTITFEGDEATLEAISRQRYGTLVRLLRSAAPRARSMRRSSRSAASMLRGLASTGQGELLRADLDAGAESLPPEADAFMDEFMREQERRWVETRIQALGGLTPREALADPEGAVKLQRLLDDWEWQEREARREGAARRGVGTMQVRRIRELLGIRPHTQA